jgi:hypothetical protein
MLILTFFLVLVCEIRAHRFSSPFCYSLHMNVLRMYFSAYLYICGGHAVA